MSQQLKCYNCGGDVIVGDNPNIGICSNCFAEVPLPKDLASLGQAYSHANALLSGSHFQEARDAFREILVRAPLESAACWGYAVSEYGIEFVQDPATAQLLPTLHRLSNERFSDYLYVKKAIEYAPDAYTQQFYTEQSKLIDSIQSHSLQISRKEDPYDIFICYKKTETGEKRTADSRIAADLYKELVRRGYKTFFAEETLQVGEEYEPRIFAALNSAKILLAIGSRQEYYEAVWVKNEWSRYVDLIETEQAKGTCTRLLIPVFYNISHGQIPAALQEMPRYVDMAASDNPKQQLFAMISSHFSGGQKDDVSNIRRQVRGQGAGNIRMEASSENFVTRGTIELINGNFEQANSMFEHALEMAVSSDAYLGLTMCSLKLRGKEALHQYAGDLQKNPHFAKALEVASEAQRQELLAIANTCLENIDWARTCQKGQKQCDAAAENIINALQDFTLPVDSHRTCAQMDSDVKFVALAKSQRSKEAAFPKHMRRFLYFGNFIPAIFLFISGIADKLGLISGVDWIGLPGGLLMVVIYIASGISLLGCIPFLNGGFFTVLIRLAIGYGASMLMATLMDGFGARVLWLLVSAAVSALFFLLVDRKHVPALKVLKNIRKNRKQYLAQIPQLAQRLEQDTAEALSSAIAPYQQYYDPDAWNARVQHWQGVLHSACLSRMDVLADALRHL